MHYDLKKKKSGLGRNERKALSWDPAYCYVEFSRSLLPSVPMAGISIHRSDLTLPPGDSSRCNLVVPGGLTAVGTNMLSKAFVICLHLLHFVVALGLSPWEWSTAGRCWQHWNEEESRMGFEMSPVRSEYKGRKDTCDSALEMWNENCYWFRTLLKLINSCLVPSPIKWGR